MYLAQEVMTAIWPYATRYYGALLFLMVRIGFVASSVKVLLSRTYREDFIYSEMYQKSHRILPIYIGDYRRSHLIPDSFDDVALPEPLSFKWQSELLNLMYSVLIHTGEGNYRSALGGVCAACRVLDAVLTPHGPGISSLEGTTEEVRDWIVFWGSLELQLLELDKNPEDGHRSAFLDHVLRYKVADVDVLAYRHKVVSAAPEETRALYRRIAPTLEERIKARMAFLRKSAYRLSRLRLQERAAQAYLSIAWMGKPREPEVAEKSWLRIQGRIPKGGILVDYNVYKTIDVDFLRYCGIARRSIPRYSLTCCDENGLSWHAIGDASTIDRSVQNYLFGLTQEQHDALGRRVVRRSVFGKHLDGSLQTIDVEELGDALLRPVDSLLASKRRLIVSPDGSLNSLPFEMLRFRSKRFLDSFCVEYVSTPCDILDFGIGDSSSIGVPCVVGDPDFNLGRVGDTSGFVELPGARAELLSVGKVLGVDAHVGESASASLMQRIRSPQVLHIATHGYYFHRNFLESNWCEGESLTADTVDRLEALSGLPDPLFRCGLVFAGANVWLSGRRASVKASDVLLTAADVVGIDLRGTELVVLSACETGLGDHDTSRGVLGLRRLFKIAGAKCIIVSLWQVPDRSTQYLMTSFYRYLLRGEGRAEALRLAKIDTRNIYPHPLNWAGFICLGEPGPMSQWVGLVGENPIQQRVCNG